MKDGSKRSTNAFLLLLTLWKNRELIKQFTKRDVIVRYKGSYLGILWSFFTPILMLCVYTFVFSVIFKARWGQGSESNSEIALVLFSGIATFNLFAECINRAPGIIVGNVNFVKKVVFPLEILPVVIVCSSLVQFLFSFIILLIGVVTLGTIHWSLVLLPIVLLPLLFFSLGISYLLASLGVYFRDIGQFVGIATQALMFLSPIFYPVTIIPEAFRPVYFWNPISYMVEDMRRIIIWGQYPDWNWLMIGTPIGMFVTIFGYIWFQKTRKGFADVL